MFVSSIIVYVLIHVQLNVLLKFQSKKFKRNFKIILYIEIIQNAVFDKVKNDRKN